MAKSKYKRFGRGGRFKDQGQGLRAAVDNIRQQRQIEIDALKIQAGQQQEIDKQQISSLDRKARNEEENRRALQNLETKIYQTKLDALNTRADREVDAILGQAKERGKDAQFWETFATDYSQRLGKSAGQLAEMGMYLQAVQNDKWNRKNNPNKHDEWAAAMEHMHNINNAEALNEVFKGKKGRVDQGEDYILFNLLIGTQDKSNYRNAQRDVQDAVNNINTFVSAIERVNGSRLNRHNINTIYENAGYLWLHQHNIPFGSKQANKLLDTLNFKANARKESWGNKIKFDQDLERQETFSKGIVAEFKDLATITDPKEYDVKLKALQNRFKEFHTIIKGSYYSLGNGRYGLIPLNPNEVNNQILENTFDLFNFRDITEAAETYNLLKIFDPQGGFTIKEKGKEVGVLEKSVTLEEKLLDMQSNKEKRENTKQKQIETGKRLQKLNPVLEKWETAIKNKDWALINSQEFQSEITSLAYDPSFTNSEELTTLYKVIGYGGKETHGSLDDYLDIKGLIFSHRYEEAVNQLLRMTTTTGDIPDGFGPLFDEARLLLDLNKEGKTIQQGAIQLLTRVTGTSLDTLGSPVTADPQRFNAMAKLIEHRILNVMLQDTSTDDPQTKYQKAYNQVEKEVEAKTGIFAMKSAAQYLPPEYDSNGTIIPGTGGEGYVDKATASDTQKKDATNEGYYFLAVDQHMVPGADINASNIDELFFTYESANPLYLPNDLSKKVPTDLQKSLSQNFNSDKSILSLDQKRSVLRMATEHSYGELPDPLKILVARAKLNNPEITTYEVMNMALNAITEAPQFKSLAGLTWSPNHEDLTKKLSGTCTKSAKNNFTLCLTSKFASDNDLVELNKKLASGEKLEFSMSDKQIYDVLTKNRKKEYN